MVNIMLIPDMMMSIVGDMNAARDGLPEPSSISGAGVKVGVTEPFHSEVSLTVATMRQTIQQLTAELRGAEGAIRKTIEQLAASDESVAADAKEFLGFLDAAAESGAPAPVTSGGGSNMRIQ